MLCVAMGTAFANCEAGPNRPIEIGDGWWFGVGEASAEDDYTVGIMKGAPITTGKGRGVMVSFYMKPNWNLGQQVWFSVGDGGLVGRDDQEMLIRIDRGTVIKSPAARSNTGGFTSRLSDGDVIQLVAECASGTIMTIHMFDREGVAWQWKLELKGARAAIRKLAARRGCGIFSSGLGER